jgi:hypothetical protein
VTAYRCYFGRGDHAPAVQKIECDEDGEAIKQATSLLNMQPGNWDVEIWNEARLVARVFRRTSTGAQGERPVSSDSLS